MSQKILQSNSNEFVAEQFEFGQKVMPPNATNLFNNPAKILSAYFPSQKAICFGVGSIDNNFGQYGARGDIFKIVEGIFRFSDQTTPTDPTNIIAVFAHIDPIDFTPIVPIAEKQYYIVAKVSFTSDSNNQFLVNSIILPTAMTRDEINQDPNPETLLPIFGIIKSFLDDNYLYTVTYDDFCATNYFGQDLTLRQTRSTFKASKLFPPYYSPIYNINKSDAFIELNFNDPTQINFPIASSIPIGTTFIINNNRGGHSISLVGEIGTDIILTTGKEIPEYYKIETNGSNWIINNQLQNVYSPEVVTSQFEVGILDNTYFYVLFPNNIILQGFSDIEITAVVSGGYTFTYPFTLSAVLAQGATSNLGSSSTVTTFQVNNVSFIVGFASSVTTKTRANAWIWGVL
jgi:hypothetical protein